MPCGEEGVKVSRLLFVDDALIYYEASQDHLTFLCCSPIITYLVEINPSCIFPWTK